MKNISINVCLSSFFPWQCFKKTSSNSKCNGFICFLLFFYLRSLKAKYQSLVIRKIIRAVGKDKQLARTSIIEAMMMLKKTWGEVTEQTIRNCFRKSGISLETQEGAMVYHDDPFKGMVDDGEDDSAVDELEFDLNQHHEARPDLAPENLDADDLVDFDREVVTNESRPLFVDEIVNEYLPQPVETTEDGISDEDEVPEEPISRPSQNEVDEAIEILNRLTLFTTDLDLDPLLLKVSNKINQRRLDRMKQSSISDFFKNSNIYSDSHISLNFNNIVIKNDINIPDKKNLYILLFLSLCNTLHREDISPAYFFQNLAEII